MKPISSCHPLRLVVIDDEPIALKQLNRILSRRSYQVEVFEDPRQALKHIDRSPVDIVLTDLRMPQLSGLDVLKHVKARQPQTEVIVITGYASIEDAVSADDTITIGGETYTFYGSEDIPNKRFQLVTAGDEADDVEATMWSLCRVINRGSTLFYANYIYSEDEAPGKVLVWARSIATAAFSVTASGTGIA